MNALLALGLLVLQDGKIEWLDSYDAGYQEAQKARKLLLVHWSSDH